MFFQYLSMGMGRKKTLDMQKLKDMTLALFNKT